MTTLNPFSLRIVARNIYPDCKHMQIQWLRQTYALLVSGKHMLLTGKFPNRDKHATG